MLRTGLQRRTLRQALLLLLLCARLSAQRGSARWRRLRHFRNLERESYTEMIKKITFFNLKLHYRPRARRTS